MLFGVKAENIGNCILISVGPLKNLVLGPDWPFSMVIFTILATGSILIYKAAVATSLLAVGYASVVHAIVVFGLIVAVVVSDPGIISESIDEHTYMLECSRHCSICNNYQPANASHCESCDCCIRVRHHHCPWIGKCVGEGNMLLYFWFTIAWISYLQFGLILLSIQLVNTK
jgi:hypothetical protein